LKIGSLGDIVFINLSYMNKKSIIVILLLLIVIGYIVLRFVLFRTPTVSGLKITAQPQVNIFLDDKLVGKTPFENKYASGEYTLKLIPIEDQSFPVSSWQGKIKLNPSVLTFVNRDLGQSELRSGGEILTLDKIPLNETQLNVFSHPDAAKIIIDGIEKGITPLVLDDLEEGEHDVAVTSLGFIGRTQRVQLTSGYKLTVDFQLALSESQEASPSPTIQPESVSEVQIKRPYIVIKETETGFLRVRSGPSKTSTETAQVNPGTKYPFLEEKEGWYKIIYQEGKEGWISSRYADKKE
jgi:hypothetical protein